LPRRSIRGRTCRIVACAGAASSPRNSLPTGVASDRRFDQYPGRIEVMTVFQPTDARAPADVGVEVDALVPRAAVGRRGFLAGSVGAGFAAAVAPGRPLLAQVVTTERSGLVEGRIRIPVAGVELPAYRAQPEGRQALATVLVVHEAFGVHAYIEDVARRFARAGYQAVAPELFFRQGDASQPATIAEIYEKIISKVPDAQVMADLDATAAWAAANGGDGRRLAVTGFCWGGRIVWLYAAHQPRLRAGVAWYGRLTTAPGALTPTNPFDVADRLHAPVLGLYGAADTGIPVTTVEEMELLLSGGSEASRASKFHVYPDAPHAFHADYRPTYRKDVAEDGWKRALAWFGEHGAAA
jgi:carboxymethylenebutenolidase